MKLPLQITVHHVSISEAVKQDIREKAAKLDQFSDHMMSCRVTVNSPHHHHHKGILYDVRLDITVPGAEWMVRRTPHEDVYVAVRDAFDVARRQLEDYEQQLRGEVKRHEMSPHARVSKLFPEKGFGFLETPEGRELYFHRNSILNDAYDRLAIGTEVRFAEELGEKGPQASTVVVVRPRHRRAVGV